MALILTSRGILDSIRQLGRSKPARTTVVQATAFGVGLTAGKLGDSKKVPLIALGAGAGLHLVGATAIGDGALGAGSTMLGYRFGARAEEKAQMETRSLPAPVASKRR